VLDSKHPLKVNIKNLTYVSFMYKMKGIDMEGENPQMFYDKNSIIPSFVIDSKHPLKLNIEN